MRDDRPMTNKEIDEEIQYQESLAKLPITEDTRWLMLYVRNLQQAVRSMHQTITGIAVILMVLLGVQLKVHWDKLWP